MASTTVRASEASVRTLHQLSEKMGESMQAILDKAVEAYARQSFFQEMEAAFARLRADRDEWEEELEERRAWERTLGNDLDEAE